MQREKRWGESGVCMGVERGRSEERGGGEVNQRAGAGIERTWGQRAGGVW